MGTVIDAPPASATSHEPLSSARAASTIATSDVEHAVLTVALGPRRSSLCEIRVARKSASLASAVANSPKLATTSGRESMQWLR